MKKNVPRRRQASRAPKGAPTRPARCKHTLFQQVCNLIPGHLIPKLEREFKIDERGFTGTSHVQALLFGHASHAIGLNDICDSLAVHEAEFGRIRGARAPARNTFSNANRTRDPSMAEALYWRMLSHLQSICPTFTQYRKHAGYIHRLKRDIFALDSTTLQLTLRSIDWARHRRRKAAAKTHMLMNIGSFLPTCVLVEDAAHHDSVRAAALCAGMDKDDILLADRAYVDLEFLADLNSRGILFVLRPKINMLFHTVRKLPSSGKILRDVLVRPAGVGTAKAYKGLLRMVTALVEIEGVEREMTFITNHLEWSARTVVALYRARWAIETFFKELKQTLQLRDFVGTNEQAVKWQVWTGLLMHLLLRFLRHVSRWGHSFSRCVGIVRNALWVKVRLTELLHFYGTAGGPRWTWPVPKERFLPGFERWIRVPMGQPG
jgi:hypothetical protein